MKNMFEVKKVIGRGAFGMVYLVIKKETGENMAMKCISKSKL